MYKDIAVYIDKEYNLYGVPSSEDTTHQMSIYIEPVTKLKSPYTVFDVEEFLEKVLNLCFSYYVEKDDILKDNKSPLQKYMKTKSWKATVQNLGLIVVYWSDEKEFIISPAWQNPKMRNAFNWDFDNGNKVSTNYKKGELATAFLKVLDKVAIGPQEKNPYI